MKTIAAVLVLGLAAQTFAADVVLTGTREGQPAPSFELDKLGSWKGVSLEKLKGKHVVLLFGASWCPFTNQKSPHFEALHQAYKDKGAQFFAVDIKEEKKKAKHWKAKHSFTLPILLDKDGKVAEAYAVDPVPEGFKRSDTMISANVIIDPKGTIVYYQRYAPDAFDPKLEGLKKKLDSLLTTN